MSSIPEPHTRIQTIKGTSYVFIDKPYWDKLKKQTRHKREYIGKLGAKGEFIPNKHYTSVQNNANTSTSSQQKVSIASRRYFGATHLLDEIGKTTGLEDDLKSCFGHDYKKILSLAYFLILESESSMYRFPKFALTHEHPHGDVISSQRISEIFAGISENQKINFFTRRAAKCLKNEYLAYDTTSISSYSEMMEQIKYGYNKDLENLPQINLALVFGEESMLPVYYRKLSGNISDITTLKKLLLDMNFIGLKRVNLVLDRAFYSRDNINSLYKNKSKFIVSARNNIKMIKESVEEVRDTIKNFSNFCSELNIYCKSKYAQWEYSYVNKNGENTTSNKSLYIHVYYNGIRAENEITAFSKKLKLAETAFLNGSCSEDQKKLCEQYFVITKSGGKIKMQYNQEAINEHMQYFGFFVLLSNHIKDAKKALFIYRNKDLVEKTFSNLKNRLDMKRTKVSSEETLEGKLFVQFVALIYIAYIHQVMIKKELYKNYSIQSLLDEFDIVETFRYPGKKTHHSEITKKQCQLFSCFNIDFDKLNPSINQQESNML
jgi:transposase